MTVTLYNVSDEPSRVRKRLGTGTQYTGVVRDTGEVSVTDPVILVSANLDPGINYAYISDFSRYYYVKIRSVRVGLVEISCHVDVLMSYQADILEAAAIADRTSTENDRYSSYLIDDRQRVYTFKTICTRLMHTFEFGDYILITAG